MTLFELAVAFLDSTATFPGSARRWPILLCRRLSSFLQRRLISSFLIGRRLFLTRIYLFTTQIWLFTSKESFPESAVAFYNCSLTFPFSAATFHVLARTFSGSAANFSGLAAAFSGSVENVPSSAPTFGSAATVCSSGPYFHLRYFVEM